MPLMSLTQSNKWLFCSVAPEYLNNLHRLHTREDHSLKLLQIFVRFSPNLIYCPQSYRCIGVPGQVISRIFIHTNLLQTASLLYKHIVHWSHCVLKFNLSEHHLWTQETLNKQPRRSNIISEMLTKDISIKLSILLLYNTIEGNYWIKPTHNI